MTVDRQHAVVALASFALALVLAPPGSAQAGRRWKRYALVAAVEADGLANAAGGGPIEPGGIDTAAGMASSTFHSQVAFRVLVDRRTAQLEVAPVKPPFTRGVRLAPFVVAPALDPAESWGRVTGSWSGITGDAPDAAGPYQCSYALGGNAFDVSISDIAAVVWGAAPNTKPTRTLTLGFYTAPTATAPNSPQVECSGYVTSHSFPGAGGLSPGRTFMDALAAVQAGSVKLPVRKLLKATVQHPFVRRAGNAVTGTCDCALPMRSGDGASFSFTLSAWLVPCHGLDDPSCRVGP